MSTLTRKKNKSNQNLDYNRITRMRMMMMMMIRIINERKLRMIIRVNIIITTTMKTIWVARMIMRTIRMVIRQTIIVKMIKMVIRLINTDDKNNDSYKNDNK